METQNHDRDPNEIGPGSKIFLVLCIITSLLCVLLQFLTCLDDNCARDCGYQNKSNEYNHCTYTD